MEEYHKFEGFQRQENATVTSLAGQAEPQNEGQRRKNRGAQHRQWPEGCRRCHAGGRTGWYKTVYGFTGCSGTQAGGGELENELGEYWRAKVLE